MSKTSLTGLTALSCFARPLLSLATFSLLLFTLGAHASPYPVSDNLICRDKVGLPTIRATQISDKQVFYICSARTTLVMDDDIEAITQKFNLLSNAGALSVDKVVMCQDKKNVRATCNPFDRSVYTTSTAGDCFKIETYQYPCGVTK